MTVGPDHGGLFSNPSERKTIKQRAFACGCRGDEGGLLESQPVASPIADRKVDNNGVNFRFAVGGSCRRKRRQSLGRHKRFNHDSKPDWPKAVRALAVQQFHEQFSRQFGRVDLD